MYYLPALLNKHGMFLKLNAVLRDQTASENLKKKIERFLYCASCTLKCLDIMYRSEEQSVYLIRSYLKQIKFPKNRRVTFSAEPLFEVYAQIPLCVSSVVVMQNLLLEIAQEIAQEKKCNVPSSLNKAIKSGIETYGFDADFCDKVMHYWCNGGEYIRHVRDINEHYTALVEHTFFEYKTDPGVVLILLPDNPETKQPKSFTYYKELDALETIKKNLSELNSLVDTICDYKNVEPIPFSKNSLNLAHVGDLTKPQNRTLGLMINIDKLEKKEKETVVYLDAVELMQIIPEKEGGGNLAVRKLKPDHEVFDEGAGVVE